MRSATRTVVPDPMKGSNTISPAAVKSLMNHSGSDSGKTALCPRLEHSAARCSTLVG